MKEKKIPLRTCVVTHEKLPKKDLLRIVKTPTGEVLVDLTGKLNGRGAYIKKDVKVLTEKAKKILERHLSIKIDDSLIKEIEEVVNKSSD